MTNVFKCKIYILIRSSMCGFKVKARSLFCLLYVRRACKLGITLLNPDPTEYWSMDPFPNAKPLSIPVNTNRRGSPQPCDPDRQVLTVYGDRLHSSIYFNRKTMSHKRSITFTDLWTKSNMYASSFCFTLFVLFWFIRFYILFHLTMISLNWLYIRMVLICHIILKREL